MLASLFWINGDVPNIICIFFNGSITGKFSHPGNIDDGFSYPCVAI